MASDDDGNNSRHALGVGVTRSLVPPLGGTTTTEASASAASHGASVPLAVAIAVGLPLSAFAMFLLTRPRTRARHVNRYCILLVSCDLLGFLACVPLAWGGVALHVVRGSRLASSLLYAFALHSLAWASYDRLLGLRSHARFRDVQTPRVFRSRVALAASVGVATHLRRLLRDAVGGTCGGRPTPLDLVLWVAEGLASVAVPAASVAALGVCVAVGLVRHRDGSVASTRLTRRRASLSAFFSAAFAAAFAACVVPLCVLSALRADACDADAATDLLLATEHLTHFLFLSFHHTFRTELRASVATLNRRLEEAFRRRDDDDAAPPPAIAMASLPDAK